MSSNVENAKIKHSTEFVKVSGRIFQLEIHTSTSNIPGQFRDSTSDDEDTSLIEDVVYRLQPVLETKAQGTNLYRKKKIPTNKTASKHKLIKDGNLRFAYHFKYMTTHYHWLLPSGGTYKGCPLFPEKVVVHACRPEPKQPTPQPQVEPSYSTAATGSSSYFSHEGRKPGTPLLALKNIVQKSGPKISKVKKKPKKDPISDASSLKDATREYAAGQDQYSPPLKKYTTDSSVGIMDHQRSTKIGDTRALCIDEGLQSEPEITATAYVQSVTERTGSPVSDLHRPITNPPTPCSSRQYTTDISILGNPRTYTNNSSTQESSKNYKTNASSQGSSKKYATSSSTQGSSKKYSANPSPPESSDKYANVNSASCNYTRISGIDMLNACSDSESNELSSPESPDFADKDLEITGVEGAVVQATAPPLSNTGSCSVKSNSQLVNVTLCRDPRDQNETIDIDNNVSEPNISYKSSQKKCEGKRPVVKKKSQFKQILEISFSDSDTPVPEEKEEIFTNPKKNSLTNSQSNRISRTRVTRGKTKAEHTETQSTLLEADSQNLYDTQNPPVPEVSKYELPKRSSNEEECIEPSPSLPKTKSQSQGRRCLSRVKRKQMQECASTSSSSNSRHPAASSGSDSEAGQQGPKRPKSSTVRNYGSSLQRRHESISNPKDGAIEEELHDVYDFEHEYNIEPNLNSPPKLRNNKQRRNRNDDVVISAEESEFIHDVYDFEPEPDPELSSIFMEESKTAKKRKRLRANMNKFQAMEDDLEECAEARKLYDRSFRAARLSEDLPSASFVVHRGVLSYEEEEENDRVSSALPSSTSQALNSKSTSPCEESESCSGDLDRSQDPSSKRSKLKLKLKRPPSTKASLKDVFVFKKTPEGRKWKQLLLSYDTERRESLRENKNRAPRINESQDSESQAASLTEDEDVFPVFNTQTAGSSKSNEIKSKRSSGVGGVSQQSQTRAKLPHKENRPHEFVDNIQDEEISQITFVDQLNHQQLIYLVKKHQWDLFNIFQGKSVSRRHQDYKKGGRERLNLKYQIPMGCFDDTQHDTIIETLLKIFCRRHQQYLDYVLKVMLPEALIMVYMHVHKTDAQAAEAAMTIECPHFSMSDSNDT